MRDAMRKTKMHDYGNGLEPIWIIGILKEGNNFNIRAKKPRINNKRVILRHTHLLFYLEV